MVQVRLLTSNKLDRHLPGYIMNIE